MGAGGWAHAGEGPAAKRSETWEPVGTRVNFVSTSAGWDRPRTSLYTDHYELTMLQAALHSGAAHRKSVFEAFARRLPDGRRYGIVGGTGRLLEGFADFRFGDVEIDFLAPHQGGRTRRRWSTWPDSRFSGDIWGYAEGEAYFPNSPILIVESTFAEACILETYILSILNHDSAIASAASRMITAAGSRPCVEMGSRRTQEESAVSAARAAIIAGFDSTSNLEAGTALRAQDRGHGRALLHPAARLRARGVRGAGRLHGRRHHAAGGHLRRRDGACVPPSSWRAPSSARSAWTPATSWRRRSWVRQLLDDLGNQRTRIMVTSDLDEFAIAALQSAPVDSYGVGTSLVTGSGAPTASMVYKLVSRTDDAGEFVAVAKAAKNKTSKGGRKYALRRLNERGTATQEMVGVGTARTTTPTTGTCCSSSSRTASSCPAGPGREGVLRAHASATRTP